jgi:tetratricopeptide (TPR) repeat protein
MPARTYMVVDPRHDHSFRVPRPDLTATIGIPNACSKCHLDQVASWAADATARWYGSGRSATTQYGEVLDAGRRRTNGAARALAALSRDAAKPAIVRATALWLLAPQLEAGSVRSVRAGLRDSHALVRMAAVSAAEMLPPEEQRLALEPLLTDPRRAVRIEAGRALAPLRQQLSEPRSRIALDQSLDEYRAAQSINADRPESHVSLGILQIQLGEMDAAQRAYETAIRLGPFFVPAYVNLADLLRMRGADAEGERILREGLARVPDSASLHHGLGLLLVRRQRLDDALDALGRAAELQPGNARYAYVHGVALHSTGRKQRALAALEEGHRAHPADTDLLVALVTIYRDEGDVPTALRYARQLVELRPEDPATHTLVRELEAMRP